MPFVSMIMVRSMSQTTERFNLCSANGFVLARRGFVRFIERLPQMLALFDVLSQPPKVPPPILLIRYPVKIT